MSRRNHRTTPTLRIATFTAVLLGLSAACGVDQQDPTAVGEDNIVAPEPECAGGDCDPVKGNAKFCTNDMVCHSFVKGYRLPVTLPNGNQMCPPGFTLKPLNAANPKRLSPCDAASAFAWPLPCETGCYGDVKLPVRPKIVGACCEYDYVRECKPLPMCVEPVPAQTAPLAE